MSACYHCSKEFPPDFLVARATECPNCARDVRVCKNCVHYAPDAHWECRETIPERVADKERGNFCDYFKMSQQAQSSDKDRIRALKAKADFAALFKDQPGE